MSEILIQAKNIKKYFPTSDRSKVVKAVDDISFDIYKGETLGVVGGIRLRKIHHGPHGLKAP